MKTPFEQGDAVGFDEAKYKRLLEELEISEVSFKQLLTNTRIDAEIYQPFYLNIEEKIKRKNYTILESISNKIKKGIFDIKADVYSEVGIPFVRINNLKQMGISMEGVAYIPEIENEKNLDTFLKKNDIILSKTAYPAASIVNIENCNTSQDTVAIKLKHESPIKSSCVVVFLNSYFGYYQMERWFTGNIQMHLNLDDCKGILIPFFSDSFQNKIDSVFWKSFDLKEKSQNSYHKAESLLLETLGLTDFKPSQEKVNVKTFNESFIQSGRLDAEYYQMKYEEIVSVIQAQKHELLGNLVSIKKSIEPGSSHYDDTGIPFLRVADFNKFGISAPQKMLSEQFVKANSEQIEKLKPKAKTILFSKDGSVGNAFMLDKNENLITSGAILHLTVFDEKVVLPQYLTLVLNSFVVKMQAERDSGGSIILHWKPSEIEQVLTPIVDFEIQKQISQKVTESFRLKKQSEQLLETAKRAVEMAIEKSEEEAMVWIQDETKALTLS